MKIAHIVSTYPPYYGGMGNVAFQMASGLADLGHTVEVFTPQYYRPEEIKPREAPPILRHAPEVEERVDYARRLQPSLQYGNAARLAQLKKELDAFDIVHLHYPFFGTAGLVRRWKRWHPDRPLVITYHMDTRGPGWKGVIFKLYSRFWMPRILWSADCLTASSFDYLEGSEARNVFHAAKERWIELPFGVDLERFFPGEKDIEPTVLFVGVMDAAHYFKGVPVLLNALYLLKKRGKPVQAILVGEGELRGQFEAQAKALGLSDTVRFMGGVTDEELPDTYRAADVLALPSLSRSEAFGMVLLEALASGIPVIASNVPGVRNVPKDAGILVPPNDARALAEALERIFSGNLAALKARARAVAEEYYDWRPIVKKLEGVYQSLVAGKRG